MHSYTQCSISDVEYFHLPETQTRALFESIPPPPQQSLIWSLLQVSSTLELPINKITEVLFCLGSFGSKSCVSILYIVTCVSSSFVFIAEWYLVYEHTTLLFLAIKNEAALDTCWSQYCMNTSFISLASIPSDSTKWWYHLLAIQESSWNCSVLIYPLMWVGRGINRSWIGAFIKALVTRSEFRFLSLPKGPRTECCDTIRL